MKLYYPAIFIPNGNGYTVEFPDLKGCVTQGESLEEAFEMAEDAAGGWILTSLEDEEIIPTPSKIESIKNEVGFINYIAINIEVKESFETMNKIAELICFHAKCRENGESIMKPFHMNKKQIPLDFVEDCNNECVHEGYCGHNEICLEQQIWRKNEIN